MGRRYQQVAVQVRILVTGGKKDKAPYAVWRETKDSFNTLHSALETGVKDLIRELRKQIRGGEEEERIIVRLDMTKAVHDKEGDQ